MKYVRKIVALVLGIALLAAAIVCVGRIFAIKNINVSMLSYEEDSSASYDKVKQSLNVFKGESLLFLDERSVSERVESCYTTTEESQNRESKYSLVSVKKKFPCTVNVVLKERLEVFAVSVGGWYSMYDSDGKYLRSWPENVNIIDGTPNVELSGLATEKIPSIAAITEDFKSIFGGLRSVVSEITIDSRPNVQGHSDKLVFTLRCGLKIQIDDYTADTHEKLICGFKKYSSLTDWKKLSGTIRCYRIDVEEGIINAEYIARQS